MCFKKTDIFEMLKTEKVLLVIIIWICHDYTVTATISPCFENRTESCIQNLATFITLDNPRFVGEAELERLCRAAEDGQRCSSDFLRSSTCISADDQLLIPLQIGRSQEVSKLLCSSGGYVTDPAFRRLYLKYASCIEEHHIKIKDCYASSNVVEEPELGIVRNSSKSTQEKQTAFCCPLVQYIECSENGIGANCEIESKTVILRVLTTAAGKQLEDFCTNLDPAFPNSPATCLKSSAVQTAEAFSFYFSMFSAILVFNLIL